MNIPEMIMTILISIGIGKFSEYQSPKYIEPKWFLTRRLSLILNCTFWLVKRMILGLQ